MIDVLYQCILKNNSLMCLFVDMFGCMLFHPTCFFVFFGDKDCSAAFHSTWSTLEFRLLWPCT